ncbi:MAG: exopolysaccharide biosynthesis polyprenyl glycosylphosphotransferase [Melioribacteraceae bacterium]|nr:exopolysaccharide biosynthesis polyprenyl glycosylphosphotransferase [Melioribacteraceae bacterium]
MLDQKSLLNLRKILDFLFLNISFLLAAFFAQPIEALLTNQLIFILLILQNIIWYTTSAITSTYYDATYRSFSDQFFSLGKNIIIEIVFAILYLFFVKENLFTRNFVFYFSTLLIILIYSKEYLVWKFVDSERRKGKNLRNLIVVGVNDFSLQFVEEIELRSEFGYKFIGFIDESLADRNVLGRLSDLEKIITDNKITDVIYSGSLDDQQIFENVVKICDKNVVKLTILPQIKQFFNSNIEMNFLGNFPVLTFRSNKLEQFQWRFLKRIFDIIFSILALILILWWVYLIIGLVIKFTSKGKVLFNQERIGRGERTFLCYKFRTMRGMDSFGKNALVDDSNRITPIGKILRKYSLDELPQFINVLKGDMSIVGPRPHAVNYNNLYSDMVEEIKLRHRVKPGITGWAQVHGLRGDVFDFEENKNRTKKRIDFDNWYIENWSVKLDIKIIIETVWQIISGRNLGT